MATDPAFASTPVVGSAILGSAETSLTVPTNASTILTAGSSGTLIAEVDISAVTTSLAPTTVAGLVYLFIYDGTNYRLRDTISVSANTASATASPYLAQKTYVNLIIPSGCTLKASQSVSGNANLLCVMAFGGNY